MNRILLSLLALALWLAPADCWAAGPNSDQAKARGDTANSPQSKERTWVATTENGDKPGIALVLIEKAGNATGGKFYILDPNHPHALSKGKSYNLSNVKHSGKTITGDVSVIDGSSKTGTKEMHLTITLEGPFEGDRVRADVQEGNGRKQPFVFVREKGGGQ
jgi:hypothetical protein